MSISLTEGKHSTADIAKIAGDLMGAPVAQVQPISQGANSRVYHLMTSSGEYVMKFYFQHPKDPRDRLGTEFNSLSFLWDKGIREIPQALRAWPEHGCALYAFVRGTALNEDIKDAGIQSAVTFLTTLKSLSKTAVSSQFKPASEAFFSPQDIVQGLRNRLKRFDFHETSDAYLALQEYVQEEFLPLFKDVETWAKDYLSSQQIAWGQELLERHRTLSPSDFGFHNALRRADGKIIFLDFEYFGWDDPVKMVSDFLWHPAMNLSAAMKTVFVAQMQKLFADDAHFQYRLKAYFPIFGLKWSLIMLNEFVVLDMQRRNFAQQSTQDKSQARLNQLAKARALTDRIKKDFKEFSYGN